jgi:hypothetical protein
MRRRQRRQHATLVVLPSLGARCAGGAAENVHFFKGQTNSKWFFQADVSSKKWTNKFDFTTMIPQVDLFSFVFWKKLKTPKRHFEIDWPLVTMVKLIESFAQSRVYLVSSKAAKAHEISQLDLRETNTNCDCKEKLKSIDYKTR